MSGTVCMFMYMYYIYDTHTRNKGKLTKVGNAMYYIVLKMVRMTNERPLLCVS